MASWLRKVFFKKKQNNQTEDRVYSPENFDELFKLQKKILGWMSIQLTHDISNLRSTWWSIIFWFQILNMLMVAIVEFLTVVISAKNASSLKDAGAVLTTLPPFGYTTLSLIKSIKIKTNRRKCEEMYDELRNMWPRGKLPEEEDHIVGALRKEHNIIIKAYCWLYITSSLVYLSPPFVLSIKRYLGYNGPRVFMIKYWLPFDVDQPVIYESMLLLQSWQSVVLAISTSCWEMLFYTYLAHIRMQFDLLGQRVRKLVYVPVDKQLIDAYPLANYNGQHVRNEEEAVTSYSDHDWDIPQQRELMNIVKRHQALIRLAEDVESMFSFGLLAYFLFSSVTICFCGFCCVLIEKWNELPFKIFLVVTLSDTWVLCWYGQKLLDSSLGLSQALYESGWYNGSKKIRRTILIMLSRAQKGVHVTTYGFSVVALESYSTIIKTSWSYFTFLLNIFNVTDDGMS